MNTEHVTTQLSDRVELIRFNRPDKKNALTQAMYAQMADSLAAADQDPGVRVIVLTGTADCFTAGNDIADFLKQPPSGQDAPVLRFMHALSTLRKPVVAAINGPAVGIGTTLLLHVDLAYAGENARFHMPFVNIGICPEYASTYLLPRLIGHVQACELLMLAQPFSADKALEARLVNAVLPDGEVFEHAMQQARQLAQQPPQALRTTKALLRRWTQDTVSQSIEVEAQHFGPMLRDAEALEALTAFMQKRAPDFSRFD